MNLLLGDKVNNLGNLNPQQQLLFPLRREVDVVYLTSQAQGKAADIL